MAYKDPEDQKRYMKKHYEANKQLYLARAAASNTRRRTRLKEHIRESKNKPCHDCGILYPYYVMQFDHLDPTQKLFNIGNYAGRDWSISKVQAEIDKCDVVCANCHAERTHARRSGDRI